MKIKSVSKKSVILMEFDWVLFIATICLSVFGIVMIYSATRTLQSNTNVIVQSGAMVLGCAAMLVTCFFDYEQLKNLVKPIYIFAVAILLLVLVFGVSGDWGARSWIRFGAIGIQPSEIAKICFIVTFSCHLSKVHDDINKPLTILGLLLHIGVLVGLILLQPDMGSVLVFLFKNFHINIYCRLVWQGSRHCLLYISMYFRNISRNVFRCFSIQTLTQGAEAIT